MKKKLGLLGCVLVMIASLLLLTACEDGTGNSYEFFQNIMNNVPVPLITPPAFRRRHSGASAPSARRNTFFSTWAMSTAAVVIP